MVVVGLAALAALALAEGLTALAALALAEAVGRAELAALVAVAVGPPACPLAWADLAVWAVALRGRCRRALGRRRQQRSVAEDVEGASRRPRRGDRSGRPWFPASWAAA
mmetsp:Transcript_28608/g.82197  ORF Transcript_28608/g.82197 Transcript_28608/m.82197 type:complete len:109 (+) Transcript_28608:295-621(+)